MRYAMIMAGGSGTRLWPMSRRKRPKQILPFINGKSLLAIAAARLEGVVQPEHRMICGGEVYRGVMRQAVPSMTDEQILGEPEGRDSMNAVGFTAAVLLKRDPRAVFGVLTSDHLIEPQEEFVQKFELGFRLIEDDPSRFVTFGIKPTFAATSYGWVELGEPIPGFPGAFRTQRFAEKPDAATAKEYMNSGRFNWNSGMFIFSAAKFMDALNWYMPENHAGLMKIADAWDTPDRKRVLNDIYPKLKKISVDFGVMEPASRDSRIVICTIPMNVNWMDVGSWTSYGETLQADVAGNRAGAKTAHLDSRNVMAVSDDPNHTIATVDCEDLIIIHTHDATLVCPRASAERIKELAQRIDERLQ